MLPLPHVHLFLTTRLFHKLFFSHSIYCTVSSYTARPHPTVARCTCKQLRLCSKSNSTQRKVSNVKSVMLNIYEPHLSRYTYPHCINLAFTHTVIHARICVQVYRMRVDRSLQPPQNPECIICYLSTVDWEPCANADLLLAALLCFISALCHRSNLSKTVRQPAPHSIQSNSIPSPI